MTYLQSTPTPSDKFSWNMQFFFSFELQMPYFHVHVINYMTGFVLFALLCPPPPSPLLLFWCWLCYFTIRNKNVFPFTLGSFFIERRSMTSRFSKETASCIVERWNEDMGYRFVPECNHAQESHTCHFFFFVSFFMPYLQKHRFLRSRNFASMATWRKDFFPIYSIPSLLLSRPSKQTNVRYKTRHSHWQPIDSPRIASIRPMSLLSELWPLKRRLH